jgi:hypothetical protein
MHAGRAVLAFVASLLFAVAGSAQGKELPRITVTCVDTEGKPVAGAEVHVFQYRGVPGPNSYEVHGPILTDANGTATAGVALDREGGKFDRWFYARVPGKLVGGTRWFHIDPKAPPPPAPSVRLEPSRELHGVVHVPNGFDVRSVRVRTLSLSARTADGGYGTSFPREHSFDGLRNSLPERFDAAVDVDGRFTLRDLPPLPLVYLEAVSPGLAQAQWFNALLPERRIPDLVEMRLVRESTLVGTCVDAAGAPVGDIEVQARLESRDRPTGVNCTFTSRTDATGSFHFAGLPGGEFAVSAVPTTGTVRPQLVVVKAKERAEFRITVEPIIEVRGIVFGGRDRIGIEGVIVVAITADDRMWRLDNARTDAQGRFLLRLPTGRARIHMQVAIAGWEAPKGTIADIPVFDVRADDPSLQKLEFELQPSK